jgi:exportin-7
MQSELLDKSITFFLNQFRRSYLTETYSRSRPLFGALGEVGITSQVEVRRGPSQGALILSMLMLIICVLCCCFPFHLGFHRLLLLDDHRHMLTVHSLLLLDAHAHCLQLINFYLWRITTNLRRWWTSESLVDRTLTVLSELTAGFASSKFMVQLESARNLLLAHNRLTAFIQGDASQTFLTHLANSRLRTRFYASLARLLLSSGADEFSSFNAFMDPFHEVAQALLGALQAGPGAFDRPEIRFSMAGFARDLRGVVFPCARKSNFTQFFEWIHPTYLGMFASAVPHLQAFPPIINAMLKFWCELVQNRSQRIAFDNTSAGGYFLYREASRMLCTYMSTLPSSDSIVPAHIYELRYKNYVNCLNVIRWSMSGGFVNFGVFRLYGDSAVEDMIQVFFHIIVTVPLADLLVRPLCL